MSTLEDILAGRMPKSAPTNVQAAIKNTIATYTSVRAKRETLAKNPNLSPVGIVDESRKFIQTDTSKRIALARSTAASFQKQIATRKASTLPPRPSAADAALMPEYRTALRGMSPAQQRALLFSDPPNLHVLQAAMGAPAALSGVAEDILAKAVERYVAITHPTELAAIAEDEESLNVLNAAVGMTCLAAKNIGEFPSDAVLEKFIETAAPAATGATDQNDSSADLLKQLGQITKTEDWQKESDERHARFLAEARAELAAI